MSWTLIIMPGRQRWPVFMTVKARINLCLFLLLVMISGCIPVPVSTVPLHPRQDRPVAFETSPAENFGMFSAPAFDATGTYLAVYDSGSNLIRIFRSSDMAPFNTLQPKRRPWRLSFSPHGRFLVIEAHAGWIGDYLSGKKHSAAHVALHSPEAYRDSIQRVEIWNLQTGQTIPDLSCDAVITSEPEGGWLWARKWAIVSGYRHSALLEAHFSSDEEEFSVLCWNGVQQRWDPDSWSRKEDLPAPPFWDSLMRLSPAAWFVDNDAAGRSADGKIAMLRIREKRFGFATLYLWDRHKSQLQRLPGECGSRLLPVYALSRNGKRLVTVCNRGMGYAIRVWELGSGKEISLNDAEFGFKGGLPTITAGGVALSPDGRYLAVSLLEPMEALLPNIFLVPAGIARSDLRLWDVEQGKELAAVPIDNLVAGVGYFSGVDLAFSPDNSLLVLSGRKLRLYRLPDLISQPH